MPRESTIWGPWKQLCFSHNLDFVISHEIRKTLVCFHLQLLFSGWHFPSIGKLLLDRTCKFLSPGHSLCCPSFWALNPWDSLCDEPILWLVHTPSLQSLNTGSGCQEAMGWVMSKVLGTLSFSSRGIPSSHFSLADWCLPTRCC